MIGSLLALLLVLVAAAPVAGQDVVISPDREKDLHGLEAFEGADLRIFMAGNQFFLMPELSISITRRTAGPSRRSSPARISTCAIR